MASLNYSNFDLLIEPTQDGYRAHVTRSPVGQIPSTTFQLPATMAASVDQLGLVGGAIRAFQVGVPPDRSDLTPLDPEEFGRQLFTALFQDELRGHLRRSLDRAADQNSGLRIRLYLHAVPGLAALPWEYLFNPFDNNFFVLSDKTPIVRYQELAQPETPLTTALPLRILAVIADAQDVEPQLDTTHERARLEEALKELSDKGSIEITWLEHCTLTHLQQILRRGEYHIFHFIGHGWFDESQGEGGLLLVNEEGFGQPVAAKVLGTWLNDHRPLRLAFLNACEGARIVEGEPFGGVAQTLVQRGLPAVIAMQFPITDEAAIILAKEFYSALADGVPVDAALTEARKAIYGHGQSSVMEWGTPVLFLRADDGRLFVLDEASESVPPAPIDPIIPINPWRKMISSRYVVPSLVLMLAILLFTPPIRGLVFPLSTPTPTVTPTSSSPTDHVTPTPTSTATVVATLLPGVVSSVTLTSNPTNPLDTATYIHIPAGELQMGTSDDQLRQLVPLCESQTSLNCNSLYAREVPQHPVAIPAFWIMQTEVTNAQYLLCYDQGNGPCTEPASGNTTWQDPDFAAYPITHVNWEQARIYAAWAGGRLPTEAEWEMACRSTDDRLYPWGNELPTRELANYAWNGTQQAARPVGSYPAGTNELFDMAGNVWEWTSTLYTENYGGQLTEEGREVLEITDDAGDRVRRGGSFAELGLHIRCAYRSIPGRSDVQTGSIGFRVARDAP